MNRKEAEIKLKDSFGFDQFYDEQWETIDLLFQGKRNSSKIHQFRTN